MSHNDKMMLIEYRVFKFTKHDFDGVEFADVRKGAPLYGIFEVQRDENGNICSRNSSPSLYWDSAFEDGSDYNKEFQLMLAGLQIALTRPTLTDEEIFPDAE